MEFINETDVENAGDDAQEIWVLGTELFPYEDEGVSYNQREGRPPVSAPVHYPRVGLPDAGGPSELGDAARAVPRRAATPAVIDTMLTEQKAGRPAGAAHRRSACGRRALQRVRRLEDGEELDLGAAVDAMVDAAARPPAGCAHHHAQRASTRRDLAALILIDLSESTNELVAWFDPLGDRPDPRGLRAAIDRDRRDRRSVRDPRLCLQRPP
ncbi:MAG: hypothetical protein MZV49_16115 [Rhodopseudomonas palustris]|nr:hypothetical protein [Rhodopseudomonas palustris]